MECTSTSVWLVGSHDVFQAEGSCDQTYIFIMVPMTSTWMMTWRTGNPRSRDIRRAVRSHRRDRLAGDQTVATQRQCRVRVQGPGDGSSQAWYAIYSCTEEKKGEKKQYGWRKPSGPRNTKVII